MNKVPNRNQFHKTTSFLKINIMFDMQKYKFSFNLNYKL